MGYKTVNVRGKTEKEILEELDGKFDAVIGVFEIIRLPRWRVVSIESNSQKNRFCENCFAETTVFFDIYLTFILHTLIRHS